MSARHAQAVVESTEEFGIILSPVYFLFGLISTINQYSTEEFGIKRPGIYPIVSRILPIIPRIFPITLVYLLKHRDNPRIRLYNVSLVLSKFLGFPRIFTVSRTLRSPINLPFAPVYLPFPFFCHEAPRSINLGFHIYWDFDPPYISYSPPYISHSPPYISHYHLKMGNIPMFCCCSEPGGSMLTHMTLTVTLYTQLESIK